MKFVPKPVSRFAGLSLLKLSAASPTILVVSGVVGFGATAVMAAKASRRAEPVIDNHKKDRIQIGSTAVTDEQERKQVISLYKDTTLSLARVYGPTLLVGTLSASSILVGHRILKTRHVATMLAYTGLQEQFGAYRDRVAATLGREAEKDIHDGARGIYVEDPDHKGEYKLAPVWDEDSSTSYLRPWVDERNTNCNVDPEATKLFLIGVQNYMNVLLRTRGVMFLNEVLRALGMPETVEGQAAGWLYDGDGDNYIDFGFLTSNDPHTQAFMDGRVRDVRLNFNIDGDIFAMLMAKKYALN